MSTMTNKEALDKVVAEIRGVCAGSIGVEMEPTTPEETAEILKKCILRHLPSSNYEVDVQQTDDPNKFDISVGFSYIEMKIDLSKEE